MDKGKNKKRSVIIVGVLWIVFGLIGLIYVFIQFPKPITPTDFEEVSVPIHQAFILNSWGRGGKIVLLSKTGEEFYITRSNSIPWNEIINAINAEQTVTVWHLPNHHEINGLKAGEVLIDYNEGVKSINKYRQNSFYICSGIVIISFLVTLYYAFFQKPSFSKYSKGRYKL